MAPPRAGVVQGSLSFSPHTRGPEHLFLALLASGSSLLHSDCGDHGDRSAQIWRSPQLTQVPPAPPQGSPFQPLLHNLVCAVLVFAALGADWTPACSDASLAHPPAMETYVQLLWKIPQSWALQGARAFGKGLLPCAMPEEKRRELLPLEEFLSSSQQGVPGVSWVVTYRGSRVG